MLCLKVVGVWILGHMYLPPIVKLDLDLTGVELYNGKGVNVTKPTTIRQNIQDTLH